MELKTLHKNAVASAFEKAKHYRLLNDPENAESICLDILHVQPDHQEATAILILAIADQFYGGIKRFKEAQALLPNLKNNYQQSYYAGLICERAARATLSQANPRSRSIAYDWLREAMSHFETAEPLSPPDSDEAVLRWNSCLRTIQNRKLKPRTDENYVAYGD